MTGAVPGAGGGTGSVQVGFVTRSGTNRYDGSVYHYYRSPTAEHELLLQQGQQPRQEQRHRPPVRRPRRRPDRAAGLRRPRQGVLLLQLEQQYQPQEQTRTRTMLRDSAMNGIFAWDVTVGGVTTTQQPRPDGARRGQRPDRDVRSDDCRAAREDSRPGRRRTGTINDLRRRYTSSTSSRARASRISTRRRRASTSTCRRRHRLTGTYWLQRFTTDPGPAEQPRSDLPRSAELGDADLVAQHRDRRRCVRRSRRASSTSCAAASRRRRRASRYITADQFDDQDGWGLSFPANVGNGVTHTIVAGAAQHHDVERREHAQLAARRRTA